MRMNDVVWIVAGLTVGLMAGHVRADMYTWAGSAGQEVPWSVGANWEGGQAPQDGDGVTIANGGTAVLSNDIALTSLHPANGGLTIDDGAALTLPANTAVNVGSGDPANHFRFRLVDGAFKIGTEGNFYMARDGSAADAFIGGSGFPAELHVGRDVVVAFSDGGRGTMTLGDGADVLLDVGWLYVAQGASAQAELTVNGGMIRFGGHDNRIVIGGNGGNGLVTVNGGELDVTGSVYMQNGGDAGAHGELHLNGGTLRTQSIMLYTTSTPGTSLLYLNGGTLAAQTSNSAFINGISAAYVQAGGAVFDVPAGLTVIVPQALLEDSASVGGGLVKRGGGILKLRGANTFTGDIAVEEGYLLFDSADALPANYAGSIDVALGAGVGYNTSGGATVLTTLLDAAATGMLLICSENAADNIDLSAHPGMAPAFFGSVSHTGSMTPAMTHYRFIVSDNEVLEHSAALTDAGGTPVSLEVIALAGGGMILSGANTYSGGTLMDGADVRLAHANALGSTGAVALRNGAVLRFDAAMNIDAVTARITADSEGILLIGASNAAQSINLAALPGIAVGTAETALEYTGTLTPHDDVFRLGGGKTAYWSTSHNGLILRNLADAGTPAQVVIGAEGMVALMEGNSYSGGTVVTNRGVLFINQDGLGAVPVAPDPANLYVDNGVIRAGNANFTLHENRGVAVGPGGLELHPWGGYRATFAGNLSGSGPITMTDGGTIEFTGANNTYGGTVGVVGGRNLRIGGDGRFSWDPAATLEVGGTLYLNAAVDAAMVGTVTGGGTVRKEGAGTLDWNVSSLFAGLTSIDAGTLRIGGGTVTTLGNVTAGAGATFLLAAPEITVGGLAGSGAVGFEGAAGSTTLRLNGSAADSLFNGQLDPDIALVKQGAGTQSLLATTEQAHRSLELQGGVFRLAGDNRGLIGRYYDLDTEPQPADFVSLETLASLLASRQPALVSSSSNMGADFNAGSGGANFPAPYNVASRENFIVVWEGEFHAETAGVYKFASASDDGSLIFINGTRVVNNNQPQGYDETHRNTRSEITLEAGWHPITIAFYEIGGGQGLTVWLTRPGADADEVLPNALLRDCTSRMFTVNTLTAHVPEATLAFGSDAPGIRVLDSGDLTINSALTGGGEETSIVKGSAGSLTLAAETSFYHGLVTTEGDDVIVTAAGGLHGTPVMSAGMTTLAAGGPAAGGMGKLLAHFYNFSGANGDYSLFRSYELLMQYMANTVPDVVADTAIAGDTLDLGAGGTQFPFPYTRNAPGAYTGNFQMILSGYIYIAQAGTYGFGMRSDDGSALFIDGAMVVDSAKDQSIPAEPTRGNVTLSAGWHEIVIAQRENGGGYGLLVFMTPPGGEEALVPQSILRSGLALAGVRGVAGSTLDMGGGGLKLFTEYDSLHAGEIKAQGGALLVKEGSAMQTLVNDNANFLGAYAISGGTLRIGDGGAVGDLGPGARPVEIGAAGTLVFDRAGTFTLDDVFSGSGLIRFDGGADVTLTRTHDFAGRVQVNGGSFTLPAGARLGTAAVLDVREPATASLDVTGAAALDVIGGLAGDGAVTLVGGAVTLTEKSDYDGTLRLDGAALSVDGGFGGNGTIILADGTLAVRHSFANDYVFNGAAHPVDRGDGRSWIELTPNTQSTSSSVHRVEAVVPSAPWTFSMRYEVGAHSEPAADGFAVVLHNDGRGTAAIGSFGGSLGVSGIHRSIGVWFNLYNNQTLGWLVDGVRTGDTGPGLNGVVLIDGVDVVLAYDGAKLTLTLEQGENRFEMQYAEDLGAFFSGSANPVYAAVTGATGGSTAQQFIGEPAFRQDGAALAPLVFGHTLVVEDGKTGNVENGFISDGMASSVHVAEVEVGDGSVLSFTGATDDFVAVLGNVTARAGCGTVNAPDGGTLTLEKLTVAQAGAWVAFSGVVDVSGGVLTVVLPQPLPASGMKVADFSAVTWAGGGRPTVVLVDANGDPVDAKYTFRADGSLFIYTSDGTVLILR